MHILTYCTCDYRRLLGVAKSIKNAIEAPSYFRACGPVDVRAIPYRLRGLPTYIQSDAYLLNCRMPETYLRRIVPQFTPVTWELTSKIQELSEKFIEDHADKVDWSYISSHQKLSEEFIARHADRVYWGHIAITQEYSDEFILRFPTMLGWVNCADPTLTYGLLHQSPKAYMRHICELYPLPERFMRRFHAYLAWDCIARRPDLSEEFRRDFAAQLKH